MLIYSTITTLAKDKWINPRKAKTLVGSKIFEIDIQRKVWKIIKVWYVYYDDIVLFLLQNLWIKK